MCAILAMVAASTAPAQAAAELLPDLRQAPVGCAGGSDRDPSRCTDWDVCMVADANAPSGVCVSRGPVGAVCLRFTTSADNAGDGPLLIRAHRDNADQPAMQARQAFQSGVDRSIPSSFEQAQRPLPTVVHYEPAGAHDHWHLMDFEHFELRTAGGEVLSADRKTGFCLGDRYTTPDAGDLPNTPKDKTSPEGALAAYLRDNVCKRGEPGTLDLTQGISVGSGDDYKHTVDFQWLDITGVPSGTYDVLNTVNGDRTLREKRYDNNTSSISISVQWPNGARTPPAEVTTPPKVQLLRSCPGEDHCTNRPPGKHTTPDDSPPRRPHPNPR